MPWNSEGRKKVRERLTGGKLGWVSFTLPAASQGTLYYNYGGADASKIMVGDVFPYQGVYPAKPMTTGPT